MTDLLAQNGKCNKCTIFLLFMLHCHRMGALSVDSRCLSVHLSVCPILDHKSSKERNRKLKIGRSEAHMTCVTSDPIYRSKGQRSTSLGQLMLRRKMCHTLRIGDQQTSNLMYGWSTMTCITDMCSDIRGQRIIIRSCHQSDSYLPITAHNCSTV